MMRLVMFWVFISLFVIVVLATLLLIFFGVGSPTAEERALLFKIFIVEVGAAVVALFYSLFGLRQEVAPSATEELKADVADKIDAKIVLIDQKVEHATAGILVVQGDVESEHGRRAEAAVSYIHAVTHAARSGESSLLHEVLKELLDEKLKAVTKADWTGSEELRTDVDRIIERLPELRPENEVAYAVRGLRELKAKLSS